MGASDPSDDRGASDSGDGPWPTSPPTVEFGLHRALKLFAAAIGTIAVTAVLIQGLAAGALDWTRLGVGMGLLSILTSTAWSLRFRSDARGLERRVLGIRTRWEWDDFASGRLTIGQHGWVPNSNNILTVLWRQPYLEFGNPPGSAAVWRYARALFQHAPRPAPEPGKEFSLGSLGRCAFDVSGMRRKGVALTWSSIDAVEVELPDRDATRPTSVSIRSGQVNGTCPLRMGPMAAEAGSLLSTLEACVPPAKLTRRFRSELPSDPAGRAELRKKLEASRRDARIGCGIVLAAGLSLAALFVWEFRARRYEFWEEGMPLWLNLARVAALAVMILLGVGHVLLALYVIRRRVRRDERRLQQLDEVAPSNSSGR